jgi:glycerol 3-phosphatase-2
MNRQAGPEAGLWSSTGPLVDAHDVVILDLDGVVYVGPHAVPGAAATIEELHARSVRCCYLTNNASRTPQTVSDHLRSLGIPAEPADVVTSAQVAAALLAARLPTGSRVLVIGGAGLVVALTEEGLVPVAGMDDEPVAVVQGFSPDIGWRLLAEGTRAVRAGLPWVASNLDLTVPTVYGPAPGNGSLVRAVATAAGREPDLVAGKPQPEPFQDAARRHGAAAPLVVGDRLDTDLQGARSAGMPALAVLTGVSLAGDLILAEPDQRPTHLAVDLAGLLVAHPPVEVDTGGARCRAARVVRRGDRLQVAAAGPDPLDLLRAACGAAWALPVADRIGVGEVLDVLQRFESARAWAR